jgi:hypothetical protein
MKQTQYRFLACAFCALIASGCAQTAQPDATQVKATTLVDHRLGTDVLNMIGEYEQAAGRSRQPVLISAEFVGRDGPAYLERWVVNSNGQKVAYSVTLTPVPTGGVHYAAKRIDPK